MAEESSRCVMIAIDGSEHGQRAFDFYLDNLHQPGDTVFLTHVARELDLPTVSLSNPMSLPHDQWKTAAVKRNTEINKLEADYTAQLLGRHVKHRTVVHYEKKPGEAICRTAMDENAAMIVMGTRGMGTIRRTILGSVSDYVVHHATCPVIICPPVNKRKESRAKSMTEGQ
ncbi:universal stress protein in QAH/OAS sulfhydrylase 3'region-like [Lineus longissimus]|uniref:universal stress protein in QAH/OAS sulfhydrylase 3'region-like n=1 Tax=Lineus longissimus TaxID=88925 RepID=UPI002B4E5F67